MALFSLLVSLQAASELSYARVDAQAAATQRIAINPKNHQRVCRSLRVYEEVLQRARGGEDR